MPLTDREIKYFEAVNEGTDLCLKRNPSVYLMGLGVPDPKGIFGTTLGLHEKYGSTRIMDMPVSENCMTGVAIGSALVGMRPILTHQRMEFSLLAMEQMVNQAANWYYMFGGKTSLPLVIRMIIGRGWGQGAQHSQSLQAFFAHVPGLKVVMPVTPYDAKGLFISSVEDDNPVIFIEHRWLHNIHGPVPEDYYTVPLEKARIARKGQDITIAATSYMVLEALRAADFLAEVGIDVEVIDIRCLRPLDTETVLVSVTKTGAVIVADTGWKTGGFAGEVIAVVVEKVFDSLKVPPQRFSLPDCPSPTTRGLANHYYPQAQQLALIAGRMLNIDYSELIFQEDPPTAPLDVPDSSFTGPF